MCYFIPRVFSACRGTEGGWLPSYPRRFSIGCWSVAIQSRLHEQVLLSLACTVIFGTYNIATVAFGWSFGCARLNAENCTPFLLRKSVGSLLTVIYVLAIGYSCYNISRLDPVVALSEVIGRIKTGFRTVQGFHAYVDGQVKLAMRREDWLRASKQTWDKVVKCIDALDALDESEANLEQASRLLQELDVALMGVSMYS
mmetsp:Transcript_66228/g.147227  ORF Transcript_66228/g.147227 Transcript_66228/m.147227 type:complete len:199 (+) Transcript_66228:2-598(+)